MTAALWSDEFLDTMRQLTDPLADAIVRDVFDTGEVGAVNALMGQLVKNGQVVPASLPSSVSDYFATTANLPEWMDSAQVARAEDFFARNGMTIGMTLLFASLPMCYACAKGVQVLHLTARLQTDPKRRIGETSQMVIRAMMPGGVAPGGEGVRDAQKVRLMHAAVRHQILSGRAAGVEWDPAWGQPINQEDLAGTLLSFSHIPVVAMRRMGIEVTADEAAAYLHAWNVIGHIMGVRDELMPQNEDDAAALAAALCRRHWAASEAGQQMTTALIEFAEHTVPGGVFNGVPAALIQFLNDAAVPRVLGIEARPVSRLPIAIIGAVLRIVERDEDEHRMLASAGERFGRAFMEAFCLIDRGGNRPPFEIPAVLQERWQLTPAHRGWAAS
jgi:hypothetical protein